MLITHQLTLEGGNKWVIPTRANGRDFDAITIQAEAEGGSFNSGVITIKKANLPTMTAVDISTPATTISADGFTTLTGGDWYGAALIVLDVTTAAANTRIHLAANLSKIGVFDASPP